MKYAVICMDMEGYECCTFIDLSFQTILVVSGSIGTHDLLEARSMHQGQHRRSLRRPFDADQRPAHRLQRCRHRTEVKGIDTLLLPRGGDYENTALPVTAKARQTLIRGNPSLAATSALCPTLAPLG